MLLLNRLKIMTTQELTAFMSNKYDDVNREWMTQKIIESCHKCKKHPINGGKSDCVCCLGSPIEVS